MKKSQYLDSGANVGSEYWLSDAESASAAAALASRIPTLPPVVVSASPLTPEQTAAGKLSDELATYRADIAFARGEFKGSAKVKLVAERSVAYRKNVQNGSTATNIREINTSTGFDSVTFDVQPELSENKSTSYFDVGDLRSSSSLLVWLGSPARQFAITAKLISRTREEAALNFKNLHMLKGWLMPDGPQAPIQYESLSGDSGVPRTLLLYAYGNNIKGVPTVMKSLNIDYAVDCDYISIDSTSQTKMPIICNISIQLTEIRASYELDMFDLNKYKTGTLDWW
jgi:hypothetical protein